MAAIAGIIGLPSKSELSRDLEAMTGCMRHGAHHQSGIFLREADGLRLGWVTDKDENAGAFPVWSESGRIGVILVGEMIAAAHEQEAAEVFCRWLLAQYERDEAACLERLNGCFSGVILDLRARPKAVLFNDRYGVGRLCYHETADAFYFASEAKALLRVLPKLRAFEPRSLGEMISCCAVLQNRTLFSGINLMPGGSAWTIMADGTADKRAYFSPHQWENLPSLGEQEYRAKLKDIWSRIVPRYFSGEKSVGVSLTGGVDSRMILAWAPRAAASRTTCYTFGGRFRECRDVTLARAIAQTCGYPHRIIPIDSEFLRQFPALAVQNAWISDGNLDASGTIDVHVQRKAREIAPIRITGTNGGEILRRLVAFKPVPICREVLSADMTPFLNGAAGDYSAEKNGHPLGFTVFKQIPWYMNCKLAVERSQIVLRMPYFDNELVALSFQAPPALAQSNEPALQLIESGFSALREFDTDRGLRSHPVPGFTQLRHAFQQFTFKAEYAYDYGMPHWLARADSMVRPLHLERVFLGRHKFHHFRLWYRDELAGFVKEILLDARTRSRSHFNGKALEEMVTAHTQGRRNHTLEIHKLLTIELAQRSLLEQN